MKKWFSLVLALSFVTGFAAVKSEAAIALRWSAASGFVPNGGGTSSVGILNASVNPSLSALVQLIWMPTDDIMPAQAGPGARPDFTSGSNQVVRSFVVVDGPSNTEYADFSAPNWLEVGDEPNNDFVPGWAFARVFQGSEAAIGPGSWYYDSPTIELRDLRAGLDSPQGLDVNRDSLGTLLGDPMSQQVQLVPEPSTMGLLAIGAMAAAWRRRRVTR